jgi:hypothetical protein
MEPRFNSPTDCPMCNMYRARIRELERINESHRKLNGELRVMIASWISTNMNRPMEKE